MASRYPEQYRSVATLAVAAAYVDGDGRTLTANDAFETVLASAGEVGGGGIEGHRLPMLFVQDEREAVRHILSAPKARARRSVRAVTIAGVLTPMMGEFVPITRQSQRDIVWLVTLRSPQRLPEPSTDLALRSAVTAGIVHDLRAPVQVVLGWAALLRRKHDDPERMEYALATIERNAKSLMEILEELLEETRPVWMRAPVRQGNVDIIELVRSEIRASRPQADQAGLCVSLMIDAPVVAVRGNEVHLRRVVANLLGNALKFTPSGGAVQCRVWSSGPWACIEVRDNGRGIGRDFLPRVFDAFGQEPAEATQGPHGLGLGLHVVRHLVESHGGTATAASEGIGCGATFTVLLPLVAEGAVAGRALSPRAALEAGAHTVV